MSSQSPRLVKPIRLLRNRPTKGKPEVHEKRLRPIAAMLNWDDQREAWRKLAGAASVEIEDPRE